MESVAWFIVGVGAGVALCIAVGWAVEEYVARRKARNGW